MKNLFMVDRDKQVIMLEGQHYSKEQVLELSKKHAEDAGSRGDLYRFLEEWFDDKETISVHTSGSTGVPKVLEVEKNRMIESACLTCSYLGLQKLDSALLCMPLQFIGAKMIVVRALVAGLNLYSVDSSTHPLRDIDFSPTFVPMTPQQAWGCLENPEEEARLRGVRHLLLGGMAVTAELQTRLADFPHAIWSSYAMTETLSHIALRKVNGADASEWFTPFFGVELSLSDMGTLVIHAPKICKEVLTTNDVAEILSDGTFRVFGRVDNVINSGGVKIQIEAVEDALRSQMAQKFQITAIADTNLGEQLVILLETPCPNWLNLCANLPKYWKPKHVIIVPALPFTPSGKPDRYKARELAKEYSLVKNI